MSVQTRARRAVEHRCLTLDTSRLWTGSVSANPAIGTAIATVTAVVHHGAKFTLGLGTPVFTDPLSTAAGTHAAALSDRCTFFTGGLRLWACTIRALPLAIAARAGVAVVGPLFSRPAHLGNAGLFGAGPALVDTRAGIAAVSGRFCLTTGAFTDNAGYPGTHPIAPFTTARVAVIARWFTGAVLALLRGLPFDSVVFERTGRAAASGNGPK